MLLVFGAINVDFGFAVAGLPGVGETVWAERGWMAPGGKGAVQAAAAARDGCRVRMVGAVGRDGLGEVALGGLAEAGVGVRGVARVGGSTGRAAITVGPLGHTMVVVDRGANGLVRAEQVEDAQLGPRVTVLLQMEVEMRENEALIRRARQRGARVVLNVSPNRAIEAASLRAVDVLIGNRFELAWLGGHLGTGENPASLYAALGVAVVRMMGTQGAEAMSEAGYARVPALPVQMRDTTAAGDCFVGVMAGALSHGRGLEEAMRRGAVAAALSVRNVGGEASAPGREEIDGALVRAPAWTREQVQVED